MAVFDSSAIVKQYVSEAGSAWVRSVTDSRMPRGGASALLEPRRAAENRGKRTAVITFQCISSMTFTIVLAPEADGGYSVVCPALPGFVSQGDSLAEALANIREAILLCLEVRKEQGQAPPVETPEIVAEEIRACLEDRAAEGLPLTIETRVLKVEAEVTV